MIAVRQPGYCRNHGARCKKKFLQKISLRVKLATNITRLFKCRNNGNHHLFKTKSLTWTIRRWHTRQSWRLLVNPGVYSSIQHLGSKITHGNNLDFTIFYFRQKHFKNRKKKRRLIMLFKKRHCHGPGHVHFSESL